MNKADSKSVPIIAMTANAFAEDIQKSFAAGINSHIAKPIVTEYLYKTIYEQINGTLSERGKM